MINRIAILKTQAKSKILSPNIDLEITQQVAPSIFSLRENISKSLIMPNFKIALHNLEQLNLKYGVTQ